MFICRFLNFDIEGITVKPGNLKLNSIFSIGDLNNIGSDEEKGGRLYPSWLLEGFRSIIVECDLIDLEIKGNKGYQFT